MRVLFLSEHYDPLIGGATHLVKKITQSIVAQGVEAYLIAPNSGTAENQVFRSEDGYEVVLIGAIERIDDRKGFRRGARVRYAKNVDAYIKQHLDTLKPDAIHVLSGMYLLEHLDVPFYKKRGIKMLAGILNVPPEECGLSWEGDKPLAQLKDFVQKKALGYINRRRIAKQSFDCYTAISHHTQRQLEDFLPNPKIEVIPLGCESHLKGQDLSSKMPQSPIQILTVAGINPSKNQHIIVEVAEILLAKGINFSWNIIGPVRNEAYKRYLEKLIAASPVRDRLHTIWGMPKAELMTWYEKSDLYVQTSLEEGFCMTALDAVLYQLPLIGFRTGAIPEFIKEGKGILVENTVEAWAAAIQEVITHYDRFQISQAQAQQIGQRYSWEAIGKKYLALYE